METTEVQLSKQNMETRDLLGKFDSFVPRFSGTANPDSIV